ncbi:MAG: hypothetical protein JST85_23170 [Acidobacteria bacterium]|nr:hypothetical protein [Acidobacteriota bacterium]
MKLETRIANLEAKVEQLQHAVGVAGEEDQPQPWWESVVGAFADDDAFEEAMRLGRDYRESLRPKPARQSRSAKSQNR